MAESATITMNWGSGAETLTGSIVSSSDQKIETDIALINGTVTGDLVILKDGLKALYMLSDKAVSVVCKSAAPATIQTIALAADTPYAWTSQDPGGPSPNPFSANIATIECTAAAIGTLKIRQVQDSTP